MQMGIKYTEGTLIKVIDGQSTLKEWVYKKIIFIYSRLEDWEKYFISDDSYRPIFNTISVQESSTTVSNVKTCLKTEI